MVKKVFKSLISLWCSVAVILMMCTSVFAEMPYDGSDDIIYADIENAPVVEVDVSSFETVYLGTGGRSVSLPYTDSVLFGANSKEAYSPVFITDFPSNDYGLFIKLSNIVGSKTIHMKVNVHYKGENDTTYHNVIDTDYTFTGYTFRGISLKTSATNIDKAYFIFEGGTDGYASEFDYEVKIAKIT